MWVVFLKKGVFSALTVSNAPKCFKPAVHKRLTTIAMKSKDKSIALLHRFTSQFEICFHDTMGQRKTSTFKQN